MVGGTVVAAALVEGTVVGATVVTAGAGVVPPPAAWVVTAQPLRRKAMVHSAKVRRLCQRVGSFTLACRRSIIRTSRGTGPPPSVSWGWLAIGVPFSRRLKRATCGFPPRWSMPPRSKVRAPNSRPRLMLCQVSRYPARALRPWSGVAEKR